MSLKRVYQIDLFRFLAAIAVVIFHFTFRGYHTNQLSAVDYPALAGVTRYLYLGVDLFFIISGFVIFMSMQNSTLPKFIISRFSRIYPAYWAAVTLTTVAILLFKDPKFAVTIKQYLANLTLFNSAIGVENIDGVYWSLIIEMKFYFLMGIILYFGKIDKIKIIMCAWLIISVALFFLGHDMVVTKILRTILFPQYSAYFIAGMVFYLIYSEGISWLYLLILSACYALSVLTSLERGVDFGKDFQTIFRSDVIFIMVTIFYMTMLAVSTGRLKILNRGYFAVLGAITYPLYLLHQNIGFMIINRINDKIDPYILLIGLLITMILAAYLFQKWVEKPFAKIVKKIMIKIISPQTDLVKAYSGEK